MTDRELVLAALAARRRAYAPYSHYYVGAALLTENGRIYEGCNVENASYGASCCAERSAFFRAVSEGEREFAAIAIAGGPEGGQISGYAYPCGICRQVMQEFCSSDFKILVVKDADDYQVHTLAGLLPYGFGGEAFL